jgi:hypothetical protein
MRGWVSRGCATRGDQDRGVSKKPDRETYLALDRTCKNKQTNAACLKWLGNRPIHQEGRGNGDAYMGLTNEQGEPPIYWEQLLKSVSAAKKSPSSLYMK